MNTELRPSLATLWIGPQLGPIEQLCALSCLEQGHTLTIYTTEKTQGIPPGIEVCDAREVFNSPCIVHHKKTGSPALHSDIFRYHLLHKTPHTWVDLDIFCLRPLPLQNDYVFAQENSQEINGAVLRLPQTSPSLTELLQYLPEHRGYPPFFSFKQKLRYWLKFAGRKPSLAEWPWGAIGPRGLTYHLQKNQEAQYALPAEAFYPITLQDLPQIARPHALQREALSSHSYAVHLWASHLKKHLATAYAGRIPEHSFLDKEMQRIERQTGWQFAKSISIS
ncbi:MAG: hypothetical protein ACH34Y_01495 [Brachymonas sp.]|jgi:hypothetical protein